MLKEDGVRGSSCVEGELEARETALDLDVRRAVGCPHA